MILDLPVWSVLVTVLLALGALVYRLWVDQRALLLVKVPAYVWIIVVYGIETLYPTSSTLTQGSPARPAFILLMLAIGYVDWRTARDIRRLKNPTPPKGSAAGGR